MLLTMRLLWELLGSQLKFDNIKCNYAIYKQLCIYIHVLIQNCEFSPVRFSSSNECDSSCTPYMFSTMSVMLLQLCDFGATKITVPFTGSSTKMAGLLSQTFSATTVKLVGWLFKHLKPYHKGLQNKTINNYFNSTYNILVFEQLYLQ